MVQKNQYSMQKIKNHANKPTVHKKRDRIYQKNSDGTTIQYNKVVAVVQSRHERQIRNQATHTSHLTWCIQI